MHPQQHGSIMESSIVSNFLQYTGPWKAEIIEGNPLNVIYLDFKRAFDTGSYERLMHKAKCFGVRDSLLSWICDFLFGRTSHVRNSKSGNRAL